MSESRLFNQFQLRLCPMNHKRTWNSCRRYCETSRMVASQSQFWPDANHKGLPSGRENKCWGYYMSPSSRPCSLTLAVLRRGPSQVIRSSKAGGVREERWLSPPSTRSLAAEDEIFTSARRMPAGAKALYSDILPAAERLKRYVLGWALTPWTLNIIW